MIKELLKQYRQDLEPTEKQEDKVFMKVFGRVSETKSNDLFNTNFFKFSIIGVFAVLFVALPFSLSSQDGTVINDEVVKEDVNTFVNGLNMDLPSLENPFAGNEINNEVYSEDGDMLYRLYDENIIEDSTASSIMPESMNGRGEDFSNSSIMYIEPEEVKLPSTKIDDQGLSIDEALDYSIKANPTGLIGINGLSKSFLSIILDFFSLFFNL
ncbi:MAG: hypothetical protein Q9M91_00990 [Candidatus Dojkabacteria bacterium]|nr:hypothetical protein [Candidatus Dojkabacteria bacterium]MDQ7020402.1 hypothetical protein [Candidatus Dojkabacteria bacterium]